MKVKYKISVFSDAEETLKYHTSVDSHFHHSFFFLFTISVFLPGSRLFSFTDNGFDYPNDLCIQNAVFFRRLGAIELLCIRLDCIELIPPHYPRWSIKMYRINIMDTICTNFPTNSLNVTIYNLLFHNTTYIYHMKTQ